MQGQLERPPGRLNTAALLEDLSSLLPAGSGQEGLQRVLARVSKAEMAPAAQLSAAARAPTRRCRSRRDSSVALLHPAAEPSEGAAGIRQRGYLRAAVLLLQDHGAARQVGQGCRCRLLTPPFAALPPAQAPACPLPHLLPAPLPFDSAVCWLTRAAHRCHRALRTASTSSPAGATSSCCRPACWQMWRASLARHPGASRPSGVRMRLVF